MRLTLRTLLAYLDDTLDPAEARELGLRVAQSEYAQELVDRIKKVTRRRGLAVPTVADHSEVSDPNTVAEYLSDELTAEQVAKVEENCLNSDAHLAEMASCHQILTLVLAEPVRVPPTAHRRMYKLMKKPASQPDRAPGRTLPIGGAIPVTEAVEPDEQDAALLLGMRRYSSSSSAGGQIFQVVLVLGLAACLLVAIIMAFPRSTPVPLANREPSTVKTPSTDSGQVVPTTPSKKRTPPVQVASGDPRIAPMPRLVGDAPPEQKKDPTAVAKPVAALPGKPSDVRRTIGKLETPDQVVLLARSPERNTYERVLVDVPAISSTDSLICLPGYKAKIKLDSGVIVDLWGNTPEQLPGSVFESRVQLFVPPEGFDADIAVRCGRIFVTTTKPGGAKVRFRTGERVWDATLTNDKAEALLEVIPSYEPGVPLLNEGGETPRMSVAFAASRGKVGLNVPGAKDFGTLTAPKAFFCTSESGPIEEIPGNEKTDYFTRYPLLPPDPNGVRQARALAMQRALTDLAGQLKSRDGLKTRIAERLSEEGDFSTVTQVMPAKLAVYCAAAIDEPSDLVDALNSALKPFTRDAATFALERWLPMGPDNTVKLRQQLLTKQFPEAQADQIVRLLRHYSPEDLKRAETLDLLVNLLSKGESTAVRELAFWTLITFVDPSAFENNRLNRYDAGGTPADREAAATAWRQRVSEIKRKNEDKK